MYQVIQGTSLEELGVHEIYPKPALLWAFTHLACVVLLRGGSPLGVPSHEFLEVWEY